MDKLTWYAENGQVYCRRGYEVALARLASYEATGLSPDEVTKMGMMFEDSKRYSGRLELKLDALSEKIPQWIPVTERLPRDRGNVLVVAFWHERWGLYGLVCSRESGMECPCWAWRQERCCCYPLDAPAGAASEGGQ